MMQKPQHDTDPRETDDLSETAERILDVAETLFAEHGFTGTSLRTIAREAGVNLAATNYHFGSKMGLLEAVFRRGVSPINRQRLALLDELERSGRSLTVEEILTAFFKPVAHLMSEGSVAVFMARMFGEPESRVRPILQKTFGQVMTRFQAALARALPDTPTDELRWRFHFMVGSMIHLFQFRTPLSGEPGNETAEQAIERLVRYSIAGMTQSPEHSRHV